MRKLRRRYGRMSYELGSYRGYKIRVRGSGDSWTADVLKRGFIDATEHAASRDAAVNKAKRVIDAMHGD